MASLQSVAGVLDVRRVEGARSKASFKAVAVALSARRGQGMEDTPGQ